MVFIFILRNEQDDINIDVVPHISMANKSSWSMPQDPTRDCDVPPDPLRTSTPPDSSDDSSESDNEQIPSNPTVLHDLPSASNSIMQPHHKEHFSTRSRIPLPHTPLENSLHNLVISGSQLPADGQVTEESIHNYEQIDEQLSSSGGHKKINFGLPDIENPQKKSLALTHTKSKTAAQKDNQDSLQGDKFSDESEGYVIEKIDFKHPVTSKMDKLSDESEGYVIEQIEFEHPVTSKIRSPYLKIFATSDGTVSDDDDDRSEYYEWCEVKQLQIAATTRSGAFVAHSGIHQISQLYDRDIMARQCMDTSHTVALTGERTYSDSTGPTTKIKQSNISELRRIDSTTSDYIRMHKANNPTIKGDSHVYMYDYVHHSCVQMCKHRRQCTGIPPRKSKHTECRPSIPINIKKHKSYANFEIIENHTIFLPPRGNHNRPTPKRHTNYKPPMPPRNIPRPGCYLSAPSAV